MKIAIMQPTYMPWMGYFGLMDKVDVFVFLDSVQFSYQSWQQHNQIKTSKGPMRLTIPVLAKSKGRRSQLIRDVIIDTSNRHLFPEKHIRAIELNYQNAPYFERYAPSLFTILRRKYKGLSPLTEDLIVWIRDVLGITTLIGRSSDMKHSGLKAELVASLCEGLGACEYFSPIGAKSYIAKSDSFQKRGISVSYLNFTHPEYPQCYGEFIPYMSVIDLLFNMGDKSLEIIRKSCLL